MAAPYNLPLDLLARLTTGMPVNPFAAAPPPDHGPGMATGTMIPGFEHAVLRGTNGPNGEFIPNIPNTFEHGPFDPSKATGDAVKLLGQQFPAVPEPTILPDDPGADALADMQRVNAGVFDRPRGGMEDMKADMRKHGIITPNDPLLQPGDNVDPQQLMDYVGARQQRDFRERLAQRLAGQNAELDARIARGPSANPIPAGLRGPDDLANRLARMPDEPSVVPGPDDSVVNAARDMSAQIAAMPKTFQPETGEAVPTINFGSPEYQQYLDTVRARIDTGMNRPEMRAAGVPDVAVHLNSATNPRRQPSAAQRTVMKEAAARQRARADQADTDRAARNEAFAKMQFLNQTGAEGLDALNRPGIEGRKLDIAQKAVDNENAQATSKQQFDQQRLQAELANATADRELKRQQGESANSLGMKELEAKIAALANESARINADTEARRAEAAARLKVDEGQLSIAQKRADMELAAAQAGLKDRADAKTKATQDELIARLTMDPSLPLVEHQARMISKMAPGPEQDTAIENAKAQKLARLVRSWRGQTTLSPVNRGNEDDEFRRQLIDILGISPESADRYVEQYFPFSRHFSFFGGHDPLR